MHSVFVPDFSHSFLLPRFYANGVLGEAGLGFNISLELYSVLYLSIYFSNLGNLVEQRGSVLLIDQPVLHLQTSQLRALPTATATGLFERQKW